MANDTLRDQVAKAVCSIAIGSERVESVMDIIQEHTAKAELRADARARVDEIKQRAAIERVRALHGPCDDGCPNCHECALAEPCPTIRALDGTEADRG